MLCSSQTEHFCSDARCLPGSHYVISNRVQSVFCIKGTLGCQVQGQLTWTMLELFYVNFPLLWLYRIHVESHPCCRHQFSTLSYPAPISSSHTAPSLCSHSPIHCHARVLHGVCSLCLTVSAQQSAFDMPNGIC